MEKVGRGLRNALAVVGLGTVTGGFALSRLSKAYQQRVKEANTKLPEQFFLELDLETVTISETSPWNPLALIGQAPSQFELRKVVAALREAGRDERVKGVVALIGDASSGMGFAVAQELHDAVTDFRKTAAGRAPLIAYSDSFGEAGTMGTIPYYLASAFGKVYMQPTGLLSMHGIAVEATFFKDFLRRWNIKTEFLHREEYKSAGEQFTEERFSKPAREALQQLITSLKSSIVQGIASSRGVTTELVDAAIEEAPLSAKRAVELKLIDGAKYRDEATQEAKAGVKATGSEAAERVTLQRYMRVTERVAADKKQSAGLQSIKQLLKDDEEREREAKKDAKPEVAVVLAEGPILRGSPSSPSSAPLIESTKLAKTLHDLVDKDAVKAVVLRVSSPGGSAVASDTIYREVKRLTAAGKPVVVSMGNVAASGGYFISAPATKIVAQPTTITGSIGVVLGKFNIAGGLEEVGITTDAVAVGRNALGMSPFTDFTPEQRKKAEAMVEDIYQDFLGKVSAGRHLSPEATRAAARGRVWTGADALRLGLVDELGGLQDAIAVARREAGLPQEEDQVEVVDYPKPQTSAQILGKLLKGEPLEAVAAPGLAVDPSALQAAVLALSASSSGGGSALSASLAAAVQQLLASSPGAAVSGNCGQQAAAAQRRAAPQMVCDISVR